MSKSSYIFQLLLVFLAVSFIYPTNDLRQKVLSQIRSFYNTYPIEKIYLHLDKPYYVAGEQIWFKVYPLDGMGHRFIAPSRNVYVDLIDPHGEVLESITLSNDAEGVAGDFGLNDDCAPGIFTIRAYTRSMQNFSDHFFFQKEIRVYDRREPEKNAKEISAEDFDIQFFPEGGNLINGISSKVGFKAVGSDGNGIDVSGRIIDETGQFVAVVKALKFGLGFFSIAPVPGKNYTAEITHQGTMREFSLPRAMSSGLAMQCLIGQGSMIKVVLQSSQPGGLRNALLYGHLRGTSFVAESLHSEEEHVVIEIPTDSLEEGVAHLTLFNPNGIPTCERLVFISKTAQDYQLKASTDEPSYSTRTKVKLSLYLESAVGPTYTNGADLSVSVTDKAIVAHPPNHLNIRSFLLLTSELRGRIEQPGYFFDPTNRGAATLLDLLMMTQGWRRFDWKHIMSDQPFKVRFAADEGFTISGQITNIGGSDKPIKARVFLNALDDQLIFAETTTLEDGMFSFTGITFSDTTDVILKAQKYREPKNKKAKERLASTSSSRDRQVSILLNKFESPDVNSEWAVPFYERKEETITKYIKTQHDIAKNDSSHREWTIDLDPLTVKARKIEKEDQLRQTGQIYSRPDQRLVLDSLGPVAYSYTSIYDLLQNRFAGVQVEGVYPSQRVTIRGISSVSGSNAPLFLFNGVIISGDGVNDIAVQDVAYIDVLKSGATAAIFGSRASNGVIAIYSRKGSAPSPSAAPRVGIMDFAHPGYYQARQFYAPNYDTKLPEHVKPDIRTTLYWNPKVMTNKDGKVDLEFYTGDKKSVYQIDVQGMTKDGTPLVVSSAFKVE